MEAIFTWFGSLFQGIYSLIRIALWLLQGMQTYSTVLLGSLNTLVGVMDFLPTAVASGIMAACGVLVTLRIAGRS